MKPFITLAQTRTPDGSLFSLHEHDGEYFLKINGRQLMSSTATSSELLLADLACKGLHREPHPRILIGGLGLGYTMKRALELVGRGATVQVAEFLPDVVTWNRELLRKVNGTLLNDPRVEILTDDVFEIIRRSKPAYYDAILLDTDHTPASLVQAGNSHLYNRNGFQLVARALKPRAKVAYWSACEEPAFMAKLSRSGFYVEAFPAKAHERAKRFAHMIYVAEYAPQLEEENPTPKPPSQWRGRFQRRRN